MSKMDMGLDDIIKEKKKRAPKKVTGKRCC